LFAIVNPVFCSTAPETPNCRVVTAHPNRENRDLAQLVIHSHEIRFRAAGPVKFEERSLRLVSHFVFAAILSIITTVAAASDEIAVGPWHGEGYLDLHANVCFARMALGSQQDLSFALSCKRTGNLGGDPITCAGQYRASVILRRSGWGLVTSAPPAATVSINDFHIGKTHAIVSAADRLQIELGPEAAIRGALKRGTILTVDTGTEVLRYPLNNMPELWTALNKCLGTVSDPKSYHPPPGPTAEETLAPLSSGNAADTIGSPDIQSCRATQDFLIFHGSLSEEPTGDEREELREYTDSVAPCISVWKSRCMPVELFPSGSTNAWCEIQTDYALAHVNNRRELESRHQNYLEYNRRANEIDRVFLDANRTFSASVQKPIDDYKEQQRQEQDTRDRQAEARREQDLIDALRQLGTPRTVTTQCTNWSGSVQCISH
jgi:hypothetical protein